MGRKGQKTPSYHILPPFRDQLWIIYTFEFLLYILTLVLYTSHLNLVSFSPWHPSLGCGEQSCDLSRWHTASHIDSCQLESLSFSCASSSWDYLEFTRLSESRRTSISTSTQPRLPGDITFLIGMIQTELLRVNLFYFFFIFMLSVVPWRQNSLLPAANASAVHTIHVENIWKIKSHLGLFWTKWYECRTFFILNWHKSRMLMGSTILIILTMATFR